MPICKFQIILKLPWLFKIRAGCQDRWTDQDNATLKRVDAPRYRVRLTLARQDAYPLGLHRGFADLLPATVSAKLCDLALRIRTGSYFL